MSINLNVVKVMACLAVIGMAGSPALADSVNPTSCSKQTPGNCVENTSAAASNASSVDPMANPHMGAGPYDQYNDPSCTPNLPNCYTYEPSRNLTKKNPTKPAKTNSTK
jgi:hypothetical protein